MRFVSFNKDGQASYGLAEESGAYRRVPEAFQARYSDLKAVIAGDALVAAAEAARSSGGENADGLAGAPAAGVAQSGQADLRRPELQEPRCRDQARRQRLPLAVPAFFQTTWPQTATWCCGPRLSERFDWEGELAFVIGTGGRHIAKEKAFEHIAGYACFNDVSVRDWQKHTHQFTPGKNFPGTAPFWTDTGDA